MRAQGHLNQSPIMTNLQLHELVSSQEKIYDQEMKASIPKYLSMVIYFNNTANQLIRKLERRDSSSKRTNGVATTISPGNQGSNINQDM